MRLINDASVTIVDIRADKDYSSGRIEGSTHIPANKTNEQMPFFRKQKHKTIVLVCATGFSSRAIAEKLLIEGLQVKRLSGGIANWSESNMPMTRK